MPRTHTSGLSVILGPADQSPPDNPIVCRLWGTFFSLGLKHVLNLSIGLSS